ncbi:MAG: recombination protein RecR [Acidobacteria bacterium]|nr:recombination protein RecR [Acidobacteriota bacterium]MCH7985193.1 recombination protein RecR [Acidobacteriota bacterium]MCH8947785.1 recombination protein RecR [Acidobacteriota bacterium]
MKELAPPIARLVEELQRLPGIGRKTAQRLAFHLLRQPTAEAERLAQAILDAKQNLRTCSICHNITEQDPCGFCSSSTRNHKQICVVESAQDILNVERTRSYQGLYHVLGGVLSPLQGMGPDQLNIKSLLERLKGDSVEEIIVATNPNAEGEATALYLSKLIKPLGIRITRLGMGLPAGSELEYADQITMTRALEGRREL